MEFIKTAVSWFLGLGSTVIVPVVLLILGFAFKVEAKKTIRGALMTGVGLAGLFLIVDLIVAALQPAVAAMATRLGLSLTLVDVNWADAGIAWGWPGVAGVLLINLAVNAILISLKLTKTLWVDIWSYWHGSALAGFVWALTGNVWWGIVAGVAYLTIGGFLGDWTAKDIQEFHGMPGISVPCGTTVQAGAFAKIITPILDKIPGFKSKDSSADTIRKKTGLLGEPVVLGAVLGIVIGIAAGYNVQKILGLAMQVATMMVVLPRMVSIISEGLIPIAQGIISFMREKFNNREIYVAVDCAVTLGHPSVMASTVILYIVAILLAAILPGNKLLPIASLAVIPFWVGSVVPYTKGNVWKTVLVMALYMIPILYIASAVAPVQTQAYSMMGQYTDQIASGTLLGSFDMGGDPLGFLIQNIMRLFGLSVL
ncbi:MAG: PTS galactitol transporter subunit IIC [Pelolinea sp.]|jgi:PTS system galactitol-specific IIC component|nr:PTS galactitol transporter subunit IIC [Pelolinea sp.]